MTDREVMRLALEALEDMYCGWKYIREVHGDLYGVGWDRAQGKAEDAIEALRQALEQPDPFSRLVRIMGTFDLSTGHADNWNDLLDSLESELRDVLGHYREALKVKQEPVAWMTNSEQDTTAEYMFCHVQTPTHDIPLYTAPPKREWVGLTDEEIAEGVKQSWVNKQAFESAVWWAEEKLKEKNT